MKEKDIHELIEQQDLEAKQRIWKKIQCVLSEHVKQSESANESKSDNNGKTVQNKINKIIRK